jgi:hypothetical protein
LSDPAFAGEQGIGHRIEVALRVDHGRGSVHAARQNDCGELTEHDDVYASHRAIQAEGWFD